VRRREFITLIAGAAVWPLSAHSEQPDRVRRIGVLVGLAEDDQETKARFAKFGMSVTRLVRNRLS